MQSPDHTRSTSVMVPGLAYADVKPASFYYQEEQQPKATKSAPQSSATDAPQRAAPLPAVTPDLIVELQILMFPFSIVIAAVLAKIAYFDVYLHLKASTALYFGLGVIQSLVFYFISSYLGMYSKVNLRQESSTRNLVFTTVSLSFLTLVCLLYLLKLAEPISRGWFVLWYVFSLAGLLIVKSAFGFWTRLLKAEGRLSQRVAVYGSKQLVDRVISVLAKHDHSLVISGVILTDDDGDGSLSSRESRIEKLITLGQSGACDRIILALASNDLEGAQTAISSLEILPIEVQVSPDGLTVPYQFQGMDQSGNLVLLDVQRKPLSVRGILIKTLLDYVLAAVALTLLSPFMLLIAIAIRLDSKGSVFFIQSRHGYNHNIIRVIKFRTMTVSEDGPVVTQAVRGDKRVTRVGRFLRKTSLDELPQLFNVLKGELSLVGPRPHAVAHNEAYAKLISKYGYRHKVKPGITGWAQVNGCRGETKTPEEMSRRIALDLYYIQNWSLWLDLRILLKTLSVPFSSSNVY